jgi:hypothetical protein
MESFKDRLATSEFTQMHLDLSQYIFPTANLEDLIMPFSKEDIDSVVSHLPNGKSPGPDGFNIEFMKKCCPVICQEFYNMCSGFFENFVCLQSINGSYITLVPKVQNPSTVNDFRPISLLNSSIKHITKILAKKASESDLAINLSESIWFLKK